MGYELGARRAGGDVGGGGMNPRFSEGAANADGCF